MIAPPKPKTTAAIIEKAFAGMPQDERDSIMARVANKEDPAEILASFQTEIRDIDAKVKVETAREQAKLTALRSIKPWVMRTSYQLEPNDCSRLHKLHEAFRAGNIINAKCEFSPADTQDMMARNWIEGTPSFVVQHDWAAAFKNATDYSDGPFQLPYDVCAFEFRISGVTIIVLATQPETPLQTPGRVDDIEFVGPHMSMPFIQCAGGYWYCPGQRCDDLWMRYAWKQIRAISIALDAEVATHDLVRAPIALNEKRAAKGEVPLRAFHIVKLHGRVTRHEPPAGTGTHRSPRLHFRRGHWRHYETHKTWIKWMLVGDPELGFVDKAYRL